MAAAGDGDDHGVVRGEFFTDGKTFVLRLEGTPLSGVGPTAQAAFDDLKRAQGTAGDFTEKLKLLAKDQQGEQVRAALIRSFATWLIALTLVGGFAAGMAAVAPRLAADFSDATIRMMAAPGAAGEASAQNPQGAAPTDPEAEASDAN
jgi:hypothetical protein